MKMIIDLFLSHTYEPGYQKIPISTGKEKGTQIL
jgi:hypothetical protein